MGKACPWAFCNLLSCAVGVLQKKLPLPLKIGTGADLVRDSGGYRLPNEAEWEYSMSCRNKTDPDTAISTA